MGKKRTKPDQFEMEEYIQDALRRGAPTPDFCLEDEKYWEDRDCLNCLNLELCFDWLSERDVWGSVEGGESHE